ncbi:siderophore ABC transporter substrate-binding protein [Galbibacter sp.]|jgi:iron complex transport system substrate-binding protein|uniref:siderophore ABC transporter substrate-binding protein n=1 Tax=Galbibacter sp. TaxID=2918471 RepID=UPI003A904A48
MKSNFKIAVLLLSIVFVGCKENKNTPVDQSDQTMDTVTITHELGTVEIVKNPKRVVALDFASLEMLDLLGVKVVGVPKASIPLQLSKYKDDASVVDLGNLKEINFELLNEVQPDVIFMSGRMLNSYDEISKIAPAVYTEIDYTDYLNSFKKITQMYATIFDASESTQKAEQEVENAVEDLKNKVKASDKRALIVIHNKGRFSAYGKGSRFGIIHDVFGVKEVVEDLEAGRHGQRISNEFIQNANPDYLYIIDRSAVVDKDATNKDEIENQLIQQTNAYKKGKIIYLDPEVWYLSGGGIYALQKMIEEVSVNL